MSFVNVKSNKRKGLGGERDWMQEAILLYLVESGIFTCEHNKCGRDRGQSSQQGMMSANRLPIS